MSEKKISQNLGDVTAYAFAVAHGYTGSEEQFGADQANFARNATLVEGYKNAAVNAAGEALEEATNALESAEEAQNILESVQQYSAFIIPNLIFDPEEGKLYVNNPTGATVSFALDSGRLYWKLVAAV